MSRIVGNRDFFILFLAQNRRKLKILFVLFQAISFVFGGHFLASSHNINEYCVESLYRRTSGLYACDLCLTLPMDGSVLNGVRIVVNPLAES